METLRVIQATLDPTGGTCAERHKEFARVQEHLQQSADDVQQHMGRVMASFAPGLFVGGDVGDLPQDNLDLERWFRQPKGHERRIHGHQHAGVRLVQEGPTLLLALDAHLTHPEPFTAEDLVPYRHSPVPAGQGQALYRRTIMRRARSKKQRPVLLAELEQRYLDGS
ncbi:MAG TPA: hypothetical protein VI542_20185 [Candidatus Tectomicrobia bacterium]